MNGKNVSNGILKWTDGGHIYTKEMFTDFVFRFEFTMTPGANNGLAIRSLGAGNPAYDAMCELQILDDGHERYAKIIEPRQFHGSALWNGRSSPEAISRESGEWNYQEVKVEGSTIQW